MFSAQFSEAKLASVACSILWPTGVENGLPPRALTLKNEAIPRANSCWSGMMRLPSAVPLPLLGSSAPNQFHTFTSTFSSPRQCNNRQLFLLARQFSPHHRVSDVFFSLQMLFTTKAEHFLGFAGSGLFSLFTFHTEFDIFMTNTEYFSCFNTLEHSPLPQPLVLFFTSQPLGSP